ncbi:MAG: substrate-binding domain-containing protein [Bacteroidota bacterium]
MSKTRIKDIARLARVSTGTVDRVIHQRGEVSEATRRKVELIIKELDYQPDILARNLASKHIWNFAVMMPESVDAHGFWTFPLNGINRALEELAHFNVQVSYFYFDQFKRDSFLELSENFLPSEFDGLLFAPVFQDEAARFIEKCQAAGLPIVLFNSIVEGSKVVSYVGQDPQQSGFLAGRMISYGLERGRDLVIVNLSAREDNYGHIIRRELGFRRFFEEHSDRVRNLVTIDMNGSRVDRLNRELNRCFKDLDIAGIFVTNSRVHLVGAYLADRGALSVRLIGYDLLPESLEYLEREYIDFLISQKPGEQAYRGLMTLFSSTVLKKSVEPLQYLPIDLVTKENIIYYPK